MEVRQHQVGPLLPVTGDQTRVEQKTTYQHWGVTALPPELLENILCYQNIRDICACRLVNRDWRDIVDRFCLQIRAIYRSCYPYVPFANSLQTAVGNYMSIRNQLQHLGSRGLEVVQYLNGALATR